MLNQRTDSAVRQASANARLAESRLRHRSEGLAALLTGLGSEAESAVLLVNREQWISSGNQIDPKQLPRAFVSMVAAGQPARQRIILSGTPVLAVGLPLPTSAATYVQVFPLRDLDRTFRFLSWTLLLGVVISGFAGAVLGRWAALQTLRPLIKLTSAAASAAAGDLTVRLPVGEDPDLAPLARAFNDTAETLQTRVERDARFAADVSHELRSPLTTMVNAMAVLHHRRDQLTGNARQALDLLSSDLTRFQYLVDDLLEISLADHAGSADTAEPVDLEALVAEIARRYSIPLRTVGTTGRSMMILGDRRRLERAVTNLVVNAQQHGGGLDRMSVCDGGDDKIRIEVDDAGPGVPDADKPRIFERFARGSPATRRSSDAGSGLGLALVAQHARYHRGQVWVEDRPAGGARFVIEIPRYQS